MDHFRVLATDGQARVGEIVTRHGVVQTPAFVPCATHGSIRGVPLSLVRQSSPGTSPPGGGVKEGRGATSLDLILANAYHLYLRPGIKTIEQLGGLHQFMNWDRPIITDSGGFQAFALPKYVRYEPDGIRFRSHLDGSKHFFSPERVIDIQQRLGVDIATCLDVCTGFPVPESEVVQAVDQTNAWAEDSIKHWTDRAMLLYGMVQGSIYLDQRRRSAEFLRELPFSGFAIGGNMYTFGKPMAELESQKGRMWEVLRYTTSLLPENKPRHLLGVGEPSDLIAGVAAGIDTFDCVMATRMARHGSAWVVTGDGVGEYERVNLTSARYKQSPEPLDERCGCRGCQSGYQRGHLHHLFKIGDPLAGLLVSLHNLFFLQQLVSRLRKLIADGSFSSLSVTPLQERWR